MKRKTYLILTSTFFALIVGIFGYFYFSHPQAEEEFTGDFGSENNHYRNTETKNLSPYAIFGDSSFVLMTEEERTGKHTLEIPNHLKNEKVKKFTFDYRTGVVKLYDKENKLITEFKTSPNQIMRFLRPDRYADKYPSLSPYNFVANNPIRFTDPTGDTIVYDANLSKEQVAGLQSAFGFLSQNSKAFAEVFNGLNTSNNIYTITIGQTSGNVDGQYKPNGKSTGGVLTFQSMESAGRVSTTVEEVFHAFQDDVKPSVYPGVSTSNIEFESKVFKYIVYDDLINSNPNSPPVVPFVNETGFANMDNDYIFGNQPLMDAKGNLNLSSQNLQSPAFQQYYQQNLNTFVQAYRSLGIPAPTYTANPSSHGPNAIIKVQKAIGR